MTDPLFLEHDTGPHHPERAARLSAIETHLRQAGQWDSLLHLPFEAATETDIWRCHTHAHIERVKTIAQAGGGALDGDTILSHHSFDAALLASGAAMEAADAVLRGEADNAFVAARPCGHHAESGRNPYARWGFCLFNHVAVAARHIQQKWGLERMAILDFDVHHGNGTQEIFYSDPSVFFASLHEWPLFPGSGQASERGEGAAVGTTLNFPLAAHSEGSAYRRAWEQVGAAVQRFAPQFIVLSAGYDAHQGDPLAHMDLKSEDFRALVADAKNWAAALCDGKLIAVLEGGYQLSALANSVAATLEVLQED